MNNLTDIRILLDVELSKRLTAYTTDISAGHITREEANRRYLCLQTAGYTAGITSMRPAIMYPRDEVRNELVRWKSELSKSINYENKFEISKKVATISTLLQLF